MRIERNLSSTLTNNLYKGKVLLVFGARRVGKTHLVKKIAEDQGGIYYNCELPRLKEIFSVLNTDAIEELIGNKKLVVLDEAQAIKDIGLKIKIIHDTYPDIQIIATGSSAFELRNSTSEPLTGRSRLYNLFPLSFREVVDHTNFAEAYGMLEKMMRYGLYPEVFLKSGSEQQEEIINIASSYLYKDILTYGQLKRPEILNEILKLLAFQIGSEISLNEISNKTNTNVHTVKRYLELLEQTFVITSLNSFSRNLRNELGKSKKYYFIDPGIRNALINNFNVFSMRNDIGPLWENFCVLERMKKNEYERRFVNAYFWRTYDQKEIDYIEEIDGKLYAFEFKWNETKGKAPKQFMEAYPGSEFKVISKSNFTEFI